MLPQKLLAELQIEAKARRLTKSQLVREILERSIRMQPPIADKSCYDLASDLAGSIEGLPPGFTGDTGTE